MSKNKNKKSQQALSTVANMFPRVVHVTLIFTYRRAFVSTPHVKV